MSSHCIQCNACCHGLTVYLEDQDFATVPQQWIDFTHGRPHLIQQSDHVRTCAALSKTGQCLMYDKRPTRCRRFQEDCPRCRAWREGKDHSSVASRQ